jgi:hypothetical protein
MRLRRLSPLRAGIAAAAACGCLAASVASAAIYKLVDKQGRVTYSSEPAPSGFEGGVTRLEIDVNANVGSSNLPAEAKPPRAPRTAALLGPSRDQLLVDARGRAEEARRAYEELRDNASADNYIYFGPGNPVGMRRMPKPEYVERLAVLERAMQAADAEVGRLER